MTRCGRGHCVRNSPFRRVFRIHIFGLFVGLSIANVSRVWRGTTNQYAGFMSGVHCGGYPRGCREGLLDKVDEGEQGSQRETVLATNSERCNRQCNKEMYLLSAQTRAREFPVLRIVFKGWWWSTVDVLRWMASRWFRVDQRWAVVGMVRRTVRVEPRRNNL